MRGKTGKAKLVAAVRRLFSVTFDQDEPLSDTVTVKREDLEAVLLCWKKTFTVNAEEPVSPKMHPEQR